MIEPYYQDGLVTLYCGECEDILPFLSDIDMVFTSPPYNLGNPSGGICVMEDGYETHDDAMPEDAYVAWQQNILSLCWSALSDTGAIFYNHKPLIREGEALLPLRLLPSETILRQIIVWDRVIGVNWSPTFFQPRYEWIMVLAKRAWQLKDRSASTPGDCWRITPESGVPDHPCPFPVALPERAIDATDARIILDPFAGAGTTLVAARQCGRHGIGIEKSEVYCDAAVKRLAQGSLFANV